MRTLLATTSTGLALSLMFASAANASTDPVAANPNTGANFNRYSYANNNPYKFIDPDGRKTTCANKQCVTTSDTYDPSRSNGQTTMASAEVRAKTNSTRWKARSEGPGENTYFIVRGSDGSLSSSTPSTVDVKAGGGRAGTTVAVPVPKGAVALVHGHIEKGERKANGMVDAPDENGGYGDTRSLARKAPFPTSTVFKGDVGWHEIVQGQLQFSYPEGALTPEQTSGIQQNLDAQQRLFEED